MDWEWMNIKMKRGLLSLLLIADIVLLCFWGQDAENGTSAERKDATPVEPYVNAEWWTYKTVKSEKTDESIVVDAGVAYGSSKKVALTFDDGPHPYYTEQLLDGLKERNVKVTFFVTGEHAALHPDIIKRIHEEGHLIGNHTYSHIQLKTDNREIYMEELLETEEVIMEIIGEEVVYVRPPYGTWDKELESELDMIPVLWTVDTLDWCSQDAASVVRKVISNVEENDIILMHDYYDVTVTAALNIVDALVEEGYTFVTVEEIMFD